MLSRKSFKIFVIVSLLVCATAHHSFAQEKQATTTLNNEVPPPPNNYTNYYFDIVSVEPNKDAKIFTYRREGNNYIKEENNVSPDEVFHLYVIGTPNADEVAFPSEIFTYSKLRTLFIGGLNLTELPADLGTRFPDLEYLDLQSTPIQQIPESVLGLKYLYNLNLAGTKVADKDVKMIKEKMPSRCLVISPR